MEPSDLLHYFAGVLDRLGVPYFVTGSMATIAYGEPRFTNDLDVVVDLKMAQADAFCKAFPAPGYYLSRESVVDAIRQQFQFNILHLDSGLKIDVFIPSNNEFERSRMSRCVRVPDSGDSSAWFASREDVILKKLVYYQEGGSEKHLRDIVGVMKISDDRIDRAYILEWANRLGVSEIWQEVARRLPAV